MRLGLDDRRTTGRPFPLALVLASALAVACGLLHGTLELAGDPPLRPTTVLVATLVLLCGWLLLQAARPGRPSGTRRALGALGAAGCAALGLVTLAGVGIALLLAALVGLLGVVALPADDDYAG